MLADCDVDAADLHLILKPQIKKTIGFHGLKIASVNGEMCTKCKKCYDHCRFGAISEEIKIIKESCEGCGVCEYVCPVDAITMKKRDSGFAYVSDTRFGPMAHAVLKTAEEASGKLVTVVRENAKDLADKKKKNLIIIDGPPGIGCPVIASLTGVDLVLIVTEPTLSAIHDLKRILGVAQHFGIHAVVCINKCTINLDRTKEIEQYCKSNNICVVGKLPYEPVMTEAMIHEKSVIEYSDGELSSRIIEMWNATVEKLILRIANHHQK